MIKKKRKIDPKIMKNLELEKAHSKNKKPSGSVLAVDYGEKFCGLAFSPDGILTVPIDVFATERIYQEIRNMIEVKKPKKLVFGLPVSSDGTENKICVHVRALASACKGLIAEIYFENERHSTQLIKDFSSKKRVDDLSAAVILKFFLERKTEEV